RRLIHVIPEAGNAHLRKVPIESAPPVAGLRARKVREDAGAWPHGAGIDCAVGILYKVVAGNASVVGQVAVTGEVCDMQIRNDDRVEVLRFKLRDHSGKVRKTFAIYCEGTVLLLVVDIQINNVGGDMIRSQTVCNFDHSRLRGVTVTRLLISKTPDRREWHGSSQPCVSFYYMLRSRSVKDVVIQRSAH